MSIVFYTICMAFCISAYCHLVPEWLKVVISATERSAASLTTLMDFTTVAACQNEGTSFHVPGSFVAMAVVSSPSEFIVAVDDGVISSCNWLVCSSLQ